MSNELSRKLSRVLATCCELKAVRLVTESFAKQLCNQSLRWFTDNQNVVRIVLHGSRKPILQVEVLAIFAVCVNSCIRLELEWIPREENEKADFISWLIDHDNWKFNPLVFRELDKKWGHIQLIGLLICTTVK